MEPPRLDASLPYHEIRSGDKILAAGEDWRIVGSNQDPLLLQAQHMAQELKQEIATPGS